MATKDAQSTGQNLPFYYLGCRPRCMDGPLDRLQAPEEEYKFDQSGAGLTIADQLAKPGGLGVLQFCLIRKFSPGVAEIADSVDLHLGPVRNC